MLTRYKLTALNVNCMIQAICLYKNQNPQLVYIFYNPKESQKYASLLPMTYLFNHCLNILWNILEFLVFKRSTLRSLIFADINFWGTNFCDWDLKKVLLCGINFCESLMIDKIAELTFVIDH